MSDEQRIVALREEMLDRFFRVLSEIALVAFAVAATVTLHEHVAVAARGEQVDHASVTPARSARREGNPHPGGQRVSDPWNIRVALALAERWGHLFCPSRPPTPV